MRSELKPTKDPAFSWHLWFAWRPVRMYFDEGFRWVWWEAVERRLKRIPGIVRPVAWRDYWIYRIAGFTCEDCREHSEMVIEVDGARLCQGCFDKRNG